MMKKRIISVLLMLCLVFVQGAPVMAHAAEDGNLSNNVEVFVNSVAGDNQGFHSWIGLNVIKAYDLYDATGSAVCAEMYYVGNPRTGYVIISKDGTILEFAKGAPAYDEFTGTYTKALYHDGGYFVDMCVSMLIDIL